MNKKEKKEEEREGKRRGKRKGGKREGRRKGRKEVSKVFFDENCFFLIFLFSRIFVCGVRSISWPGMRNSETVCVTCGTWHAYRDASDFSCVWHDYRDAFDFSCVEVLAAAASPTPAATMPALLQTSLDDANIV